MAVSKIEEYRQQNGTDILKVYCKPTRAFPNGGFFYAPAEAINLVNQYSWCLRVNGKDLICVIATDNNSVYYQLGKCCHDNVYFHAKLFEFYQGYKWQGCLDHINLIEIDNTDANLNVVTNQQNRFNAMSRGYRFDTRRKSASFTARIRIDDSEYYPFKPVRNEAEVCSIQNYLEQVWLREKLGTQYYMFDFLKYRRGSQDLLDLERTGVISEEEAVYRHILKYSKNAWYYLRYGLQDYFKQYHIPVPEYSLDEYGFMIHSITGEKLCPF